MPQGRAGAKRRIGNICQHDVALMNLIECTGPNWPNTIVGLSNPPSPLSSSFYVRVFIGKTGLRQIHASSTLETHAQCRPKPDMGASSPWKSVTKLHTLLIWSGSSFEIAITQSKLVPHVKWAQNLDSGPAGVKTQGPNPAQNNLGPQAQAGLDIEHH